MSYSEMMINVPGLMANYRTNIWQIPIFCPLNLCTYLLWFNANWLQFFISPVSGGILAKSSDWRRKRNSYLAKTSTAPSWSGTPSQGGTTSRCPSGTMTPSSTTGSGEPIQKMIFCDLLCRKVFTTNIVNKLFFKTFVSILQFGLNINKLFPSFLLVWDILQKWGKLSAPIFLHSPSHQSVPPIRDLLKCSFRQLDEGGFFIARRTSFRTLQELVEHYSRDADGLCVNLRSACAKVRRISKIWVYFLDISSSLGLV